MEGQIVKILSNLYFVNCDGNVLKCHSRGNFRNKGITPVVGDYCKISLEDKYILEILPRKNYLERPLVANIDQGLIVTSLVVPDFSTNLLDKLIIIMEINKITPIICITKEDLASKELQEEVREIVKYYKKIGYKVYYNYEAHELKKIFKNKTTVFTGQTGAGKSSLLNRLEPKLNFDVGDVSIALGRGKHTTRFVELVSLFEGKLVDSPGFSSIDLSIYSKEQIRNSFVEFKNYECLYRDCSHTNEDVSCCLVKKALEKGEILESRYSNYLKFISSFNTR